jgi:hypothetical protein
MKKKSMTLAEKKQLENSISQAEEALEKGLIQPEAAAILRRMISYYKEKIEREYEEK